MKAYRSAFQKLWHDPNRLMCSIEALGRRVKKRLPSPRINSIADIDSAFSLSYQLLIGAHGRSGSRTGAGVRSGLCGRPHRKDAPRDREAERPREDYGRHKLCLHRRFHDVSWDQVTEARYRLCRDTAQ